MRDKCICSTPISGWNGCWIKLDSEEVGELLEQVSSDQLFMTDFSFHSIGVILHRLNRQDEFLRFVQDLFMDGAVGLISLEPAEMERLVEVIDHFGLDFDDAYQYVAARYTTWG